MMYENLRDRFIRAGYRLYIVGGYVRDRLLGVPPGGDTDLSTDAVPEKVREVKAPPEVKKAEPKPEKAVAAEKKAEGAIEKIIAADRSQVKKEIKPATQTFMVQVGSYRDKAKADQVAAKMKALGYAPRVVPMELPGQGKWYRLTIGGFPSREKAAEAVTNAAKSTGSRGFIRPEGEAKAAVPPSPVKKK